MEEGHIKVEEVRGRTSKINLAIPTIPTIGKVLAIQYYIQPSLLIWYRQ